MFFEIEGKIKHGRVEHALGTKDEGDEQAAEAAVAIEERMDGLELDVGEGGLEQRAGFDRLVVEEKFEGSHGFQHRVGRRWDEPGISGARSADPVLAGAELAGHFPAAPTVGEQDARGFPG